MPATSGPAFQQITSRINKAAADLLVHAQIVESGLGQIPLQTHVQQLATPQLALSSNLGAICMLLTGLSANSVGKTLSLWLGADYFVCRALVPNRSHCFELHAKQEGGYQFYNGSELASFESLESLAAAVESYEKQADGEAVKERCQIHFPVPHGSQTLRIFVPSSLDALRTQASLTSWLGDQAQILMLSGHSDDRLDAAMTETLQPLVSTIGAIRHLVLANVDGSREIPAWTRALSAPLILPPVFVQSASSDVIGAEPVEKLVLLEFARMRQIEGAAHLVLDSIEMESTSTNNRRRLLDPTRSPQSPTSSSESNPRGMIEQIMTPFQSDVEQIRRSVEEQSMRSLGTDGELYQSIQQIVDGLTFDGLKQENLAHSIRLSVGTGALEQIRDLIRLEFTASLRKDVHQLEEAILASKEVIEDALSEKTGYVHRVTLSAVDIDRMKEALSLMIQVNIRYKGEIPRATWKTRFQGARNWMMGVSMFMMLTAGIGAMTSASTAKSLRQALMVGMLFAFIFGLFAAIFGYKKIRAEAVEREIDKLRDAAMQELTRLFQSLVGEKRRIIADHLQRASREIESEVNKVIAKHSESNRAESDKVRASAVEKSRLLENRSRTLQQSQVSCRQIGSELVQIQMMLSNLVATLPPPALKAPTPAVASPTPASPSMQRPVDTRPLDAPSYPPAGRSSSALDSFVPPPVEQQNIK